MNRRRPLARTTPRGLVLLEILVALAILAAVGVLAWGGVASIARAEVTLVSVTDEHRAVQRAIWQFERDIRAGLPRAAYDANGQREGMLIGKGDELELSVLAPSSGMTPRSRVERVSWTCSAGTLARVKWAAPDRTLSTARTEQEYLKGLTDCAFAYTDSEGREGAVWPGSSPGRPKEELPIAVTLRISEPAAGSIWRIVELPGSSAER